jgi:hypothetical protein
MPDRHFPSFRALLDFLASEPCPTYTHRWRDPGMTVMQESKAPKYLFRGEPGVYPTSLTSRGRIGTGGMFDPDELAMLDELTTMAEAVWTLRTLDRFRSLGWPQHYGFPTPYIDVTSDPSVAVHFAGWSTGPSRASVRTLYRIDLESIDHKVYAPDGRTPLSLAWIGQMYCTRATRQSAWVLCSNEERIGFDFQHSPHLAGAVERFTIDAVDADQFFDPTLLGAEDDAFAAWPLAAVRALKASIEKPLTPRVAEWLCNRIPLYEWTPCEVTFDGRGRGARLGFLSPSQATERHHRSYVADREAVMAELTSASIPVPNGVLFGMLTGGTPGQSMWLHGGDVCEVQWRYPFPRRGRSFERVVLR